MRRERKVSLDCPRLLLFDRCTHVDVLLLCVSDAAFTPSCASPWPTVVVTHSGKTCYYPTQILTTVPTLATLRHRDASTGRAGRLRNRVVTLT